MSFYGYLKKEEAIETKRAFSEKKKGFKKHTVKLQNQKPVTVRFMNKEELAAVKAALPPLPEKVTPRRHFDLETGEDRSYTPYIKRKGT